jgi:hypothetical protein
MTQHRGEPHGKEPLMRKNQRVADMVEEVLERQAGERTGEPL